MRTLLLALLLSVASLAQAQPAACPPDGGLDYYRCRVADFEVRNPGVAAPDYYLDYADRYLRQFTAETQPLLSPRGQAWMDRAKRNLQVAMEARRASDPLAFAQLERDPEAFRAFGYETHVRAYQDAGVDTLPLRDLILVGISPDAEDLFSPAGLEQLIAIGQGLVDVCRDEGLGRCALERALREKRDLCRRLRARWGLRPGGATARFVTARLRDTVLWAHASLRERGGVAGAAGSIPQ